MNTEPLTYVPDGVQTSESQYEPCPICPAVDTMRRSVLLRPTVPPSHKIPNQHGPGEDTAKARRQAVRVFLCLLASSSYGGSIGAPFHVSIPYLFTLSMNLDFHLSEVSPCNPRAALMAAFVTGSSSVFSVLTSLKLYFVSPARFGSGLGTSSSTMLIPGKTFFRSSPRYFDCLNSTSRICTILSANLCNLSRSAATSGPLLKHRIVVRNCGSSKVIACDDKQSYLRLFHHLRQAMDIVCVFEKSRGGAASLLHAKGLCYPELDLAAHP